MLVLEQPLETYNCTIQPLLTTTKVSYATIFGLNPYAFFLIFLIVGGVVFFFGKLWWNQRQRNKAFEVAGEKVLAEFCYEGGTKSILCEVFKGQVKSIVNTSRATFSVDRFIGRKENDLKGKGIIGDIDFYFYLSDHAYPCLWPEGKPRNQQITVMKTHYYVNDPMPKITYRPQEWNPDVYERVTATLLKYAQEEKVAEVAVGELAGKFTMFEKALEYVKRIPIMFLIQLGIVLLLVILIFINYLNMSDIGKLVKWVVGG